MPWLRLLLLSCVACSAACARPTLDESDDAGDLTSGDAGAPKRVDAGAVPDARVVTPEQSGQPSPPSAGQTDAAPASDPSAADSGTCLDTDADGICDPLDNCPDVANPKQEDTDGNGVGDACQPKVLADCKPDPLSSGVGAGTISQVRINGAAGTMAQVTAGETVNLTIAFTFDSCGGVYANQSLYIGLDGSSATCQFAGCSDQVKLSVPFVFTVIAPSEPGLHYVLAGLSSSFCPPNGSSSSAADIRIAALCVSPR